jgi:hypothetical protein
MLQHLHVGMAELTMEVGLTADTVSSASLLRYAGYTAKCVSVGQLNYLPEVKYFLEATSAASD